MSAKQDIIQVAQAHSNSNEKSYYYAKNADWVRRNLIEYEALPGRSDQKIYHQVMPPSKMMNLFAKAELELG